MEDPVLCVAIDFGTAYTGFCFQLVGSEQIRQCRWGLEHGFNTPKTPTSILFDKDENFLKFGYDAVHQYTDLAQRKEEKNLYFFDNFKMELYDKELNSNLMITAKNGKQMRAMKVFSESLKFMKGHALETISRHKTGIEYSVSDVKWVLTVPAIWSPAAKQFMREAAVEAGLVEDFYSVKLVIALEPEAASMYCKQLPSEGFIAGDVRETEKTEDQPGTQYVVADCGGGTIDITVHEVMEGGLLEELHKVSGNNMGGQSVDQNFRNFLREIFTDEVFDEFEENHPAELQKLMYDFMLCKRSDDDVSVQCPFGLHALASKVGDIEDYFSEISGAEWEDGAIILTKEKMRSFHDDSLRAIEKQISEILKKPGLKISYLFLVGGFSLSPNVRGFVREKFGSQCQVLCPIDAQEAVMKGAVKFGTNPDIIQSRISRYTYGISKSVRFNEIEHSGKKTFVNEDGEKFCSGCFHTLVTKDESVGYDEVRQYSFWPVERNQTAMFFKFYSTKSKTAKFVDEKGLENIGSFAVPMPDTSQGMNRSVRLEVRFGFTEMKAEAIDITTGKSNSVKLDFMRKGLTEPFN